LDEEAALEGLLEIVLLMGVDDEAPLLLYDPIPESK